MALHPVAAWFGSMSMSITKEGPRTWGGKGLEHGVEWPNLGTSSNGMPLICSLLGASRRRASNYSFWAKGKQVNAEKMVCCLVGPKSMSWLKSFHGGHVRGFFFSDLFIFSFSFIILKWGKPIENDRKSIEHQRKWMENERKWMENDNDNKWNLSIPIVLCENYRMFCRARKRPPTKNVSNQDMALSNVVS